MIKFIFMLIFFIYFMFINVLPLILFFLKYFEYKYLIILSLFMKFINFLIYYFVGKLFYKFYLQFVDNYLFNFN